MAASALGSTVGPSMDFNQPQLRTMLPQSTHPAFSKKASTVYASPPPLSVSTAGAGGAGFTGASGGIGGVRSVGGAGGVTYDPSYYGHEAFTNLGSDINAYPSAYPKVSTTTTAGARTDRGPSEFGERRHVRSVILNEQYMGPAPEESVTYIEVPQLEEIVKYVPRREIVEVEKRVPTYQYEWVDKIVEVPQIHHVDKTVEVPQFQEVVKHVTRREIVEVPREVVRHVPRIETRTVEKVVEVPGQIIEVPKPYIVENKIQVPEYYDKSVPMVVAQTMKPMLAESNSYVEVDVVEYSPEVIPVDIHVPKVVKTMIQSLGVIDEQHRVVTVPAAQYNSMLRMLNPHLAETEMASLPYYKGHMGNVQFLGSNDKIPNVHPMPNVEISGWTPPTNMSGFDASGHRRGSGHTSGTERTRRSRGVGGRGYGSQGRKLTSSTMASVKSEAVAAKSYAQKKGKGTCPC